MKSYIVSALSAVVALCALYACAVSAAPASGSTNDLSHPTKEDQLFLLKLLAPLKALAREADDLGAIVERAARDRDFAFELAKRQGSWDMDYGWGGGRFGKRSQEHDKRYDAFGLGGRFGRSVERVAEQHKDDNL